MLEQPFNERTLYSASGNGAYVVFTQTVRAERGLGQPSYRLLVISGDGRQQFASSVPVATARLDQTIVDSVVSARVSEFNRESSLLKISVGDFRQTLFSPAYLSGIDAVVAGGDGEVIVRHQSIGARRTEFSLLSKTGRVVGSWAMPTGATILAFGRSEVVALEPTAAGDVELVLYSLVRS